MSLLLLAIVCLYGQAKTQDVINNYCYGSPTPPNVELVAFSVGSSKPFSPTTLTRIPLENTIYNTEGHFHRTDNCFHVPYDGVYSFSFSAIGASGKYVSLHLMRERTGASKSMIARAGDYNTKGGSTHGGASGAAIVALEKGDRVSVWEWGDTTGSHGLYGDSNFPYGPSTLFSGKMEKKRAKYCN